MPAPRGNTNAGGSGIYAATPTHKVHLTETPNAEVTVLGLAPLAEGLADAAMWVAEMMAADGRDAAIKLAGLYARVADECYQVAAELKGQTGIRAAPLGKLSDGDYQALIRNRRRATELILGQIKTAWVRLQDRVELGSELISIEGKPLAILDYLAAHIRSAKRMLRELAADLVWGEHGDEGDTDMAARMLELLQGAE